MRWFPFAVLVAWSFFSDEPVLGAAPPPTFAKDVASILFANCSTCHRPGEVGPFSLLNYEDARKRAGLLAQVAEDRAMPPWKPTAPVVAFRDARALTDAQVATLRAWAEAGAPEGNPGDLPPIPDFPQGWTLGEPDLILSVARPYTVPADGPDIYVHFVPPMDLDRDRYIKAVQVLPSNRRVAHHGVPMLDAAARPANSPRNTAATTTRTSAAPASSPEASSPATPLARRPGSTRRTTEGSRWPRGSISSSRCTTTRPARSRSTSPGSAFISPTRSPSVIPASS